MSIKLRDIELRENYNSIGRILIVEDQSSDIIVPHTLFSHLGFETVLAFDGAQGISELERGIFDFVILDWNMPYLSGEEFLESIEKKNKFFQPRTHKVILHSGASLENHNFLKYSRSEIVDFWKKPMLAPEMAKRLKLLTER